MLQGNVALHLCQKMFFQLSDGALTFEQVAHKEQRQRAETKESHTKRPLVPNGMEEHQRVHEDGKASGLHEDKSGSENGELQLAALKMIQFLAIQRADDSFLCDLDQLGVDLRG